MKIDKKRVVPCVRSTRPTIVFDLDGVIATGSKKEVYSDEAGWDYMRCVPSKEYVGLVRTFFDEWYKIIIHTARPEIDKKVTTEWLKKHNVPYHELIMAKPFADLYVDDKAIGLDATGASKLGLQKMYRLFTDQAKKSFTERSPIKKEME